LAEKREMWESKGRRTGLIRDALACAGIHVCSSLHVEI